MEKGLLQASHKIKFHEEGFSDPVGGNCTVYIVVLCTDRCIHSFKLIVVCLPGFKMFSVVVLISRLHCLAN